MDAIDGSTPPVPARRRTGRPRRGEGPRINYDELDRVLVFGEPGKDGGPAVRYPTYRELALRYGVAVSVIGEYGRRHKCQKRRKYVASRIRARADERQIDLRANDRTLGEPIVAPLTEILQAARDEVLREFEAQPQSGSEVRPA